MILPCENPETIERTRNRVEITNIFIDQFIFLFLSAKIIHERDNRKNQKERVDNAPDRKGETNRRKRVIVLIRQLLCRHTSKGKSNREGIERHHKDIGDEIEKRIEHKTERLRTLLISVGF